MNLSNKVVIAMVDQSMCFNFQDLYLLLECTQQGHMHT